MGASTFGGGGSEIFGDLLGESEINNPWSRGVIIFRHIGGRVQNSVFIKQKSQLQGALPPRPTPITI